MWSPSASARCCTSSGRALLWAALAAALLGAPGAARAQAPGAPSELGFLESLYAAREDFRAESEALRWLHDHAGAPQQPAVELLRAKLYYRERRYAEADLMLYALLDRAPPPEVAVEARRLLGYSQLRQGRMEQGTRLLAAAQPEAPATAPLVAVPEAETKRDRAVLMSTLLPGTGFFVLGEPAKAASAIGLNVLALSAAVLSYRQGNTPAAVLFALVELALYTGGRDAVRQEADALAARERRRATEDWLHAAGEPELLRVGLTLRF